MKALWNLILLLLVIGAAFFIFIKFANSDTKQKLYHDIGIENSKLIEKIGMETYITYTDVVSRQKLNGTWIVNGWLRNTHQSKGIRNVEIQFNFSDGTTSNYNLEMDLGVNGLGKPFRVKIPGHEQATYKDFKVIRAE